MRDSVSYVANQAQKSVAVKLDLSDCRVEGQKESDSAKQWKKNSDRHTKLISARKHFIAFYSSAHKNCKMYFRYE